MKRREACRNFLKVNKVNCCSIIEDNDEGHFSHGGCDCCQNGLGTTVYDCHGYNPEDDSIVELGEVCHGCICFFYNDEGGEELIDE